jgi:hypothetical protein
VNPKVKNTGQLIDFNCKVLIGKKSSNEKSSSDDELPETILPAKKVSNKKNSVIFNQKHSKIQKISIQGSDDKNTKNDFRHEEKKTRCPYFDARDDG